MITKKKYKAMTGYDATQDDLERCNCKKGGDIGHSQLFLKYLRGICKQHKKPRFICGCINIK